VLLLALLCVPLLAETDDAAAAAKGVVPPADWLIPPQAPLQVLAVRGLWYQYYGVDRALARLGGAAVSDSWHVNSWETGVSNGLRYFPGTYDALMRHHLIILCNINAAAMPPIQRKMLKDYVERGGALLFLGGNYAYDGQYGATAFGDITPVAFPAKPELRHTADGAPMTAGKDAPAALRGLGWAATPRVYWYHALTPKPGAQVLLTAGETPLLVTGAFGKGRVAVFAGSVMGDPPAGQTPLWAWADWPAVVAETITWLTAPTRAPAPVDPAVTQQLTKALLGPGVKKFADVAPRLMKAADCCRDDAGAALLLRAVHALDDDPALEAVDAYAQAIRRYAGAEALAAARLLIESGLPHKVSLGLRVLGQCAPAARETLLTALRTGEPPGGDDDDGGLGGLGGDLLGGGKMTTDPAYMAYAVRLGALEGLGNLGDAAAIPHLRRYRQQISRSVSNPADFPTVPTQEDELNLAALLALVRCGDAAAAAPAVDALMELYYVMVRNMTVVDLPQYARKSYQAQQLIAKLWKTYPRVRSRDALLYRQLATVPPAVLPALAKRLAAETPPRAALPAFAAFGRAFRGEDFTAPAEALDALAGAKLPALAELAQRLRTK